MRSLEEIVKSNREAAELAKNGPKKVKEVLNTEMVHTAIGVIVPVDQEAVRNAPGIQPWSRPEE